MSPAAPRNLPASVQERLRNVADREGEPYQYILTRYGLERLLYRLGRSVHRDHFILKGAMLFSLWDKAPHRPTVDADFLGFGSSALADVIQTFRDICRTTVDDDGLEFQPQSLRAQPIREEQEYDGVRIRLSALLGRVRIDLQADIGFGDAVTPAPEEIDYPTLLEFPPPHLKAYPRETVITEKFEAMMRLGMANSRMKDFYDIWVLAAGFEFDGATLADAISATFARRQTPIPKETPLALTPTFSQDATKRGQWSGFLTRNRLDADPAPALDAVVSALHAFLMPPVVALADNRPFRRRWLPGRGWAES